MAAAPPPKKTVPLPQGSAIGCHKTPRIESNEGPGADNCTDMGSCRGQRRAGRSMGRKRAAEGTGSMGCARARSKGQGRRRGRHVAVGYEWTMQEDAAAADSGADRAETAAEE